MMGKYIRSLSFLGVAHVVTLGGHHGAADETDLERREERDVGWEMRFYSYMLPWFRHSCPL